MRIASALLFSLAILPGVRADGQSVQTGFLDRSVTIGGVAYPYEIYVPASYSTAQQWPVILFLHGAGERGGDRLLQTSNALGAAIRRAPSAYPAIVVLPQVPNDSSWVGVPSQVAMTALDNAMAEFRIDPDRVYLTGLSMGGNGTWHLAYNNPGRFAAIAPICGFVTPLVGKRWKAAVPMDTGDPYETLARRIAKLPRSTRLCRWNNHARRRKPSEKRGVTSNTQSSSAWITMCGMQPTRHHSSSPGFSRSGASGELIWFGLAHRRRSSA